MNHFREQVHGKEQAPETEGNVLHSANSYDLLTGWLLRKRLGARYLAVPLRTEMQGGPSPEFWKCRLLEG